MGHTAATRVLIGLATLLAAGASVLAVPADAGAHHASGPPWPWCSAFANSPFRYEGSGPIQATAGLGCTDTVPNDSFLQIYACLEWYDRFLDEWVRDACTYWEGTSPTPWGPHAFVRLLRDCTLSGHWRTLVHVGWRFEYMHYETQISAPEHIYC